MPRRFLKFPVVGLALLAAAPIASVQAAPRDKKKQESAKPAAEEVDLSHFEIDHENPSANLPTAKEAELRPLLFAAMIQDLGGGIEAARERGDFAQAVKYDQAWTVMAPQHAASFTALCSDLDALNRRDEALQGCANAIQKPGVTVSAFARFVRLVIKRPGGPDPVELEDARNAIDHLKSDEASRILGYQLQCELSLTIKDDVALEECASKLSELAPDAPQSITYAWSLALNKNDQTRAQELVAKAKQAGTMPPDAVATMEKAMLNRPAAQTSSRLSGRTSQMLGWLLGVCAALLAMVFMARRFTRGDTSI